MTDARRTNRTRTLLTLLVVAALGLAVAQGMMGSPDNQPPRNQADPPGATNQQYGAYGPMMGVAPCGVPGMGQGAWGPGNRGQGAWGQGAWGQGAWGQGMMGPGMMGGQGAWGQGMMGGQGAWGQGMMGGQGAWGQGMPGRGTWGQGAMGGRGMMGPGMMGRGMMGPGMMGGQGMMGGMGMSSILPSNAEPLDEADLRERLEAAANAFGQDVRVADVMPFENHTYAQFVDGDGQGLAEVLVNRYTGIVTPEPGPNMMWNRATGMGAAMGPGMGNWMGAAPRVQDDEAAAREHAEAFLANYLPGADVLSSQAFPGYATFDYGREGQVEGMLSVNAATGAIWPHTWHGRFLGDAHD